MENANIFIRGQVWYWEDPTYGKKDSMKKVIVGEGGLRHDRYVLIVQAEDTINHDSVLVIPLSHVTNNIYDLQIPMRHIYDTDVSYARTRLVCPVHIKTLKRYICTMPESVMKMIDARLIQILIPAISKYPGKELKSLFDIDLCFDPIEYERVNFTVALKNSIKEFMDTHIEFTNDKDDKVSIYQLKDLFDEFCSRKELAGTDDMIVFIDAFNYHIPSKNYQFSEYDKYNSYELVGVKYVADGIKHIEEEKVEVTQPVINETTLPDIPVITDAGKECIITDFEKIPRYISKFGNYVRQWMREEQVYQAYTKPGIKRTKKNEIKFYEQISNGVYFSLMYFLNIESKNGNNTFNMHPSEDNPYLETWKFIYHIYNDMDLEHDTRYRAAKLMTEYRKQYGENGGINQEWETPLFNKMSSYFPTSRYNVIGICAKIKSMFCQPIKE